MRKKTLYEKALSYICYVPKALRLDEVCACIERMNGTKYAYLTKV